MKKEILFSQFFRNLKDDAIEKICNELYSRKFQHNYSFLGRKIMNYFIYLSEKRALQDFKPGHYSDILPNKFTFYSILHPKN